MAAPRRGRVALKRAAALRWAYAALAVVLMLATVNHTAGAAAPGDDEAPESEAEPRGSDEPDQPPAGEELFGSSRLGVGETLSPGESLVSTNGRYLLILGHDGELRLYDLERAPTGHGPSLRRDADPAPINCGDEPPEDLLASSEMRSVCRPYSPSLVDGLQPLWASGTPGDSDRILVMQPDGNLVLYELPVRPFQSLWHSRTHGWSGASLTVRDNGTATIGFDDGRVVWKVGAATIDSGLAGVKHIVYERGAQQVTLIEADGSVFDTYPVSGRATSPLPGTYSVYSKSPKAWSYSGGATMDHMVRFAYGFSGGRIGFHSIPTNSRGVPLQTEAELGQFRSAGCVRQRDDKAAQLYEWAPLGTPVVVLA